MATCSSGHANFGEARFCSTCGLPLDPTSSDPIPPADSPWSPAGAAAPPVSPPPTAPVFLPPSSTSSPWATDSAAPPPPPQMPPGAVPLDAGTPAPERKHKGRKVVVIGVVAVLALGAAAFAGMQVLGSDDAESNLLLVAEPDGDDNDLFLIERGQDIEDAKPFATGAWANSLSVVGSTAASNNTISPDIIPMSGGALVAWSDDDDTIVALVKPGNDEPKELYREEGDASVQIDKAGEHLLIANSVDDGQICFYGTLTEEPEQVGAGDSCFFDAGGNMITLDSDSDEEDFEDFEDVTYAVTISTSSGDELSSFSVPSYPYSSPTGALIAAETGESLVVHRASDGEELVEVQGDEVTSWGWASDADALLYAKQVGDEASIGVIDADGDTRELVTGASVSGEITDDGSTFIAATRADGEVTLSRVDTASGEGTDLLVEDDLSYSLLPGPEPKVVAWDGDGDVWYGSATSGDLEDVGSIDDLEYVESLAFDPRSGLTYISGGDSDDEVTLYAIGDEITELDGTWSSIDVIQLDDGRLLVHAWEEDDDATLIVVSDGEANEIDSEGSIITPRFEGANVLYSVSDDYESGDGTEVRLAPADGSGKPETVWEGVEIVGHANAATAPYSIYAGLDGAPYWFDAAGQCDDAPDITDDSSSGEIDESGVFYCLVVPSGGSDVTITVSSDIDTELSVYDEEDDEAAYSDDDSEDGEGWDPYIDTFLTSGVYTIELFPYDEETGTYDISVELSD